MAVAFQPELRDTVTALVLRQIQPTYELDRHTTDLLRQQAYESVGDVQITYRPDQVLFPAGHTVSHEDLSLLRAEQEAVREARSPRHGWYRWMGEVGMVLLIATGLWIYIYAYSSKVRRNPVRGVVLAALVLLCQVISVLMLSFWPSIAAAGAAFPVLLGAMVLSIVYGQRFALGAGVAMAVLVIWTVRLPTAQAMVVIVGLTLGVGLLDEVRSRSKLVWVGLWAGLGMGVASVIATLATGNFELTAAWNAPLLPIDIPIQWRLLVSNAIYASLAGLAVGLIVQGVLPMIESIFKVTTAMTLKDLNDASHPLLQKLAQESPGTYQHSLRIADMAEAAADAIGADSLLCRVGAMYHDIGKINKPMYFIENQGGGPNRHTKLSPAMSLLIILGHVKDGVEMAREYSLPHVIRHIIESHHGTTLVEYFYHAAKKKKAEEDKPAPSEFEFRYPGPKPQTREAAIMLLCDGIEGAARAMDDPTAVRLEQLTHSMAIKRLMDGQFDDCPLTLKDLSAVEAAITKTLCAVYHTRIKYPSGEKKKERTQAESPASPPGTQQPAAKSA